MSEGAGQEDSRVRKPETVGDVWSTLQKLVADNAQLLQQSLADVRAPERRHSEAKLNDMLNTVEFTQLLASLLSTILRRQSQVLYHQLRSWWPNDPFCNEYYTLCRNESDQFNKDMKNLLGDLECAPIPSALLCAKGPEKEKPRDDSQEGASAHGSKRPRDDSQEGASAQESKRPRNDSQEGASAHGSKSPRED